jgi:hypothetical protein
MSILGRIKAVFKKPENKPEPAKPVVSPEYRARRAKRVRKSKQ